MTKKFIYLQIPDFNLIFKTQDEFYYISHNTTTPFIQKIDNDFNLNQ